MPKVGMRHVVAAPITSEPVNQPIVYGTGMIATRAVSADITYNRDENKFYCDDVLGESDNSAASGTISIGGSEFLPEARVALFGVRKVTQSDKTIYRTTSEPSPYIGLGYMTVMIYKGVYKYTATWIHKMQFALSGESAKTKGEKIEWQTETATGDIMGATIDDSGVPAFKDQVEFETAAQAMAWLDEKANISSV